MLVGTMEEVDAFVHTTPWGMEQTIGYYNWVLDGEAGWSVMLHSVPKTSTAKESSTHTALAKCGGRSSAAGHTTGFTS